MSKEKITELQRLTEEIASAPEDSKKKLTDLARAFTIFSEETESLRSSYETLQGELQSRNDQLSTKVTQLNLISHYLHSILNHISQGILFIDLTGIVTTCNGPAEKILECDTLDLLFASFWEFFDDEYFGFSMRQALSEKKAPETLFTTLTAPSGEQRELEIHTTFILPEKKLDNEENIEIIQGIILVLRDRTEINRLRRLANRNDRMQELGEMAAMVAHEIRNPLGGIKGFASLLHRDLTETPQLQKMADHIIDGANTLNRLVTHVLNYSRPIHLNLEPTNLLTLCQDLYRHVEADSILNSDVIFTISAPPIPIKAAIDKQLMQASLLNLIMNAIQAVPEGGKIDLKISEEKGVAIIALSDNGIGIPEENIEKIFSPFFTTKPQGNGFGLSESHKVIQAHEGTVEVQSTEGRGTTFFIKIPIKSYVQRIPNHDY